MGDSYAEVVVRDEKDNQGKLLRNALVLIIIAMIVYGAMYQILLLETLGIIMIPVSIWLYKQHSREYEYLLVSDELDISLIKNKRKRKEQQSLRLSELQCMAPAGSTHLEAFHNNPKVRLFDYTSGNPEHKVYAMVFSGKGELIELLVEPDEAMLKEVKMRHASVVHDA